MKVPTSTLIALVILPSLTFARLRPHIKRNPYVADNTSALITRSHSDSNTNDDQCEETKKKHHGHQSHKHQGHNGTTTTYKVPHDKGNSKKPDYRAGTPPIENPSPHKHSPVNTPPVKTPPVTTTPVTTPPGKETKEKGSGGNETTIGSPKNVPAGGLLAANTYRPGFILGLAVKSEQLDGRYDNCILPHANTIVPEYEFKTAHIHPEPNRYDFGPMDKISDYAKKHNLKMRAHNFFWNQDISPWLTALKGNKAALESAMDDHIKTLLGRYGDGFSQIDVVNEFMEYAGTGRPNNDLYYGTFGDDYLNFAFNTVKKYNKNGALLVLNDNDIEGMSYKVPGKRAGLIKILKGVVGSNVPIGAVGMEAHFEAGSVPKDFGDSIQGFIDLGLKVIITELDIKSNGNLKQQADDYATIYETCIQKAGCLGIIRWDMSEDVSWEPGSKAELYGSNCASKGLDAGVQHVLRTGRKA